MYLSTDKKNQVYPTYLLYLLTHLLTLALLRPSSLIRKLLPSVMHGIQGHR